jgi:hypothetical protein
MTMNIYEMAKFKAQFPTAIFKCDDAFLAHVIGFADALGKREELISKMRQMIFPTFFGGDAITFVYADDMASFYFMIYKKSDTVTKKFEIRSAYEKEVVEIKEGGKFLMNGGMIFHASYERCPEAERVISPHQTCPGCGREAGEEEQKEHREIRNYAKGSWSIHT